MNALAAVVYCDGRGVKSITGLDWVICGGESGPGARPMHPEWARSLRDQCAAVGAAFFFKQWGEYKNGSDFKEDAIAVLLDGRTCDGTLGELTRLDRERPLREAAMMRRVGKKAAGALLDGVEHKAFPEPERYSVADGGAPKPRQRRLAS